MRLHLLLLLLLVLAAVLIAAPLAEKPTLTTTAQPPAATAEKPQPAAAISTPATTPATQKQAARDAAAVSAPTVVAAPGTGQAGYVHYWVITAPEGDEEIQVGIELPDRRIAWSFPGLGVHVAPFMAAGAVDAKGRMFRMRHLYGLRPFADEAAMRRLRSRLSSRVSLLVNRRVPYCELNGVTDELCMSCMGFVSQVLFPGRTPEYANFPLNFPHVAGEEYHTTEDLLLYLTGLHVPRPDAARQRRIAALGGPPALREELERLTAQLAEQQRVAAVADAAKTPARRGTRITPGTAVRRAPKAG
jgi:hypothetical protein